MRAVIFLLFALVVVVRGQFGLFDMDDDDYDDSFDGDVDYDESRRVRSRHHPRDSGPYHREYLERRPRGDCESGMCDRERGERVRPYRARREHLRGGWESEPHAYASEPTYMEYERPSRKLRGWRNPDRFYEESEPVDLDHFFSDSMDAPRYSDYEGGILSRYRSFYRSLFPEEYRLLRRNDTRKRRRRSRSGLKKSLVSARRYRTGLKRADKSLRRMDHDEEYFEETTKKERKSKKDTNKKNKKDCDKDEKDEKPTVEGNQYVSGVSKKL